MNMIWKRILCLCAALVCALSLASCVGRDDDFKSPPVESDDGSASVSESNGNETKAEATEAAETATGIWADAVYLKDTELGEGSKTIYVTVQAEEKSIVLTVHTDETTVGSALLKLNLVEGETSQYGLYVKKVNGMLADYDVDQTYWSFLRGGEYMTVGVDSAEITDGDRYELVRTK